MTNPEASAERIRVLFVIGTMEAGGAQRQVIELLRRLDRTRFQPLLYLTMKQGEFLDEIPMDVPVFAFWDGSPESIARKILGCLRLTRIVRYFSLAGTLKRQQIDVIYDRTFLSTIDAAVACWLRPTPRLSCSIADPERELETHARFSRRIWHAFARWAYASADLTLANSDGLRQRMISFFKLDPDRVRTCRNVLTQEDQDGLNESMGDETRTEKELSQIEAADPFLIVTASRLHPQKGLHHLLHAIDFLVHKENRRLQVRILGDGELMSELRNFVVRHDLKSTVFFEGYVPNPRVWYRKARLFVLPSLTEGSPNALVEAAACGVPVLATDCQSGPREILDGGRCGRLVPTANAKALATEIADAIDHEEEWKRRAVLAREWVLEMFDPVTGVHNVENLLSQIARRPETNLG